MKKLILVLAFVFASGSLVNAETNKDYTAQLVFGECDDVYNRTRDFVHGMTGSLNIGISAAIAAEEACLEEEEAL